MTDKATLLLHDLAAEALGVDHETAAAWSERGDLLAAALLKHIIEARAERQQRGMSPEGVFVRAVRELRGCEPWIVTELLDWAAGLPDRRRLLDAAHALVRRDFTPARFRARLREIQAMGAIDGLRLVNAEDRDHTTTWCIEEVDD